MAKRKPGGDLDALRKIARTLYDVQRIKREIAGTIPRPVMPRRVLDAMTEAGKSLGPLVAPMLAAVAPGLAAFTRVAAGDKEDRWLSDPAMQAAILDHAAAQFGLPPGATRDPDLMFTLALVLALERRQNKRGGSILERPRGAVLRKRGERGPGKHPPKKPRPRAGLGGGKAAARRK